jgi:hypothetical protein
LSKYHLFLDFELSQIKWDKNEWQPWNIRGSWSVCKSEAANPYTGLNSLCKISEIHEIGGVRHQIYQRPAINMHAVMKIIFYIDHIKNADNWVAAILDIANIMSFLDMHENWWSANPYTGLNSLCKISEIHEIGGVRHQIYQRIILCGQLAGINLDSWTLDKFLFTNLIFLASILEVPMINKKLISRLSFIFISFNLA